LEVAPSKRKVNIVITDQSALSGVILVLFWYCSDYIIASFTFLVKIFMLCILFYIWNISKRQVNIVITDQSALSSVPMVIFY
jgi:hypothetical protein